ncbi:MAG: GTPase HflX, partial [Pseudomonadota bacterium]
MFDQEFYIDRKSKAVLVSLVCPQFSEHKNVLEAERSLWELKELMRTLSIPVGSTFLQNRSSPDPATIVGKGKIEEIATKAKEEDCNLLVFDVELSASQVRNIKELTQLSVIDRCHVILEIFAQHARTREAKIQIEIARLEYLLPRLSGFWTHFSRQRGYKGMRAGEGEQQLELDRRMVRKKIQSYKKDLEGISLSRKEQKKKRQNMAITAALVGYTNAGKSSIMNRLCKVNLIEEDKLFATLDSTVRTLNPDTKPPLILIDTVGFISNLPQHLINGFKTTLESAMEADLLIVVCDISDPNYKKQIEITQKVLQDLKIVNKDMIIVFNKKDKLGDWIKAKLITRNYPNSFLVSSLDQEDMKRLRDWILDYYLKKQNHYDLFIPYDQGQAHSSVKGKTNIVNQTGHQKGIFYRIRTPD